MSFPEVAISTSERYDIRIPDWPCQYMSGDVWNGTTTSSSTQYKNRTHRRLPRSLGSAGERMSSGRPHRYETSSRAAAWRRSRRGPRDGKFWATCWAKFGQIFARFRLYRHRSLQENTSFQHFSKSTTCQIVEIRQNFED